MFSVIHVQHLHKIVIQYHVPDKHCSLIFFMLFWGLVWYFCFQQQHKLLVGAQKSSRSEKALLPDRQLGILTIDCLQ